MTASGVRREAARVEHPCQRDALRKLGVPSIPLKMRVGSDTGIPDTLFLLPYGIPLVMEFKDGESSLDPKQVYWFEILTRLGYNVQVHYTAQAGLEAIASEMGAAAIHAEGGKMVAGKFMRGPASRSRLAKNKHYTRSLQFLEEAWGGEQDARNRAFESMLSCLASRDKKMAGL